DNYYLQMVSNIRRYKGAEPMQVISATKNIPGLNEWATIKPLYVDFIGDVIHRNHPGAQSEPTVIYENKSGRNDIQNIKLLAAGQDLVFYVQSVNQLVDHDKDNFMNLWINADENYNSGWNGYDFRV